MMALIVAILVNVAMAQGWQCQESSSSRSGDTLSICGVGQSSDLAKARHAALESAKEEFNSLCQLDTQCPMRDVLVNPKRLECKLRGDTYQCFRMIEFSLGEKKKMAYQATPTGVVALPNVSIKLKRGMTKKEVLEAVGAPKLVNGQQWVYEAPQYCGRGHMGLGECYLYFDKKNDELLRDISYWRVEYLDLD